MALGTMRDEVHGRRRVRIDDDARRVEALAPPELEQFATELVVVYMLTMAALYGVLDTLFVAFQGWVLRWKA